MKFKLSTILISVFFAGFLLYGFISLTSSGPYKDYAPGTVLSIANTNSTADTVTPGNWPYPTVWNWNYSGITGVNGGTVGACYYANNYWLNRWNSTNLYLYDNTGSGGGPGTQSSATTYTGSIRDMTVAPDGSGSDFIWGGKASTTLYKFSTTGTTLGTYSIPQQMRAIVWDPNRKGFWCANWTTDIKCYDTTGALKDTYAGGLSLASKYGMAWDSGHAHVDTATLFVWHQTPGQTLTEVNLTTKTTIRSFLISAGTNIAGGAEVYKNHIGNDWWLVLNYQNYANIAYKIGEDPPSPTYFFYNDTTGSGNTFPLGQTNGKFVNWLFPPGAFANPSPCPSGWRIDTIWIRMYGSGSRTYTNLHILLAQTTMTNLTSGQFYSGPWDTVYFAASQTLTSPGANTWMPIGLQIPYYQYNTSKALVVGIGQCGGTGSGMYVLQTSVSGTKRTWSVGGCPFVPYSSGDGYNLCMGISAYPGCGITPISTNKPDKFNLSQNYPNPFNPTTTIEFKIPDNGLVVLKVYDVLGKEVKTLVNEDLSAGVYSVDFDASNLTSGVYFYRIEAGDYIDVKKMVLLK